MIGFLYSALAFVPILFYIILIFITTPMNFSIKRLLNYLLFGTMSVGCLIIFRKIFPGTDSSIVLPFTIFDKSSDSELFLFFIQVGLIEEMSKYLLFTLCKNMDKVKITLIDIMIYCGITALGFSFIENIFYIIDMGTSTIMIRAISSTILHMTCGFIMGYFIAIGRMKQMDTSTIFNYFISKRPNLKPFIFSGVGVLSASFLHGLYDFNACSDSNSLITLMILILLFGVTITFLMSRDLINKMRQLSANSWKLILKI